jgi:membrane protease YdiL (CAAX protease family)
MSEEVLDKQKKSKYKVKPSVGIGLAIYFLYLAIFFTVWIVNKVDYPEIGKTLESTKLHYAMPTLIASIAVAIVISFLGWWKIVLFDKEKSGPKWAWIGPIAMLLLAVGSLTQLNGENVGFMLVFLEHARCDWRRFW